MTGAMAASPYAHAPDPTAPPSPARPGNHASSSIPAPPSFKWPLDRLARHLEARGHAWGPLRDQLCDVAALAVAAVAPLLRDAYWSSLPPGATDPGQLCELLGIDVLLEREDRGSSDEEAEDGEPERGADGRPPREPFRLRPVLLELNHMPSLSTDGPEDLATKLAVTTGALACAALAPAQRDARKRASALAARSRLAGGSGGGSGGSGSGGAAAPGVATETGVAANYAAATVASSGDSAMSSAAAARGPGDPALHAAAAKAGARLAQRLRDAARETIRARRSATIAAARDARLSPLLARHGFVQARGDPSFRPCPFHL